jgi:hypothetical protein
MDDKSGGWAILYGSNPVTSNSLNLAVDEDQAKDSERSHTTEQVAYIVFDTAGAYHAAPALASVKLQIPPVSVLLEPYPCPANPETWIPFRLNEADRVTVSIHDIAGRLVRTLDLGYLNPGIYSGKDKAAYWDGRNEAGEQISSGIYFCVMQAGKFRAAKKMIISR